MRVRSLLGIAGVAVLSTVAVSRDAHACGGCFHPPSQSGDVITDERMGFVITPQQTTLYDEINYQGNPASFAWVLPIHGQVTVGLSSDVLFQALDAATQTTIVAPNLPPCASCQCGALNAGPSGGGSGSGSGSSSGGGVTVLSQQTVGPYDTVQLSSTNPNALNAWLAVKITSGVGTMWCAYAFAALALVSLPSAIESGSAVVLVSWISQTFLQLVLLSVIIVGQNVLAAAADKRADATYKDADAVLHEAVKIQEHLAAQDAVLEVLVRRLEASES